MDEFAPIEHFIRLSRYWWLIIIACLIGGGVGIIFHDIRTPVYEAKATFYIGIDTIALQNLNLPTDQFLYNEELAFDVVQAVLMSPEVLSTVASEIYGSDPQINEMYLVDNSSIERKRAFWELRFRHIDPATAQAVTNLWAEKGYQKMLNWFRTGKVPNYVVFTPPTLASLPQAPEYYGRNQVVLAGLMIGFFGGVLLVEVLAQFKQ